MDGNSENIGLLLRLQSKIWMLKWCSLFLLIMFVTGIILHVRDNRRNQRLQEEQEKENTELKAKLYDKGISKSTPAPTAQK